jgi:hypothetical protein
MKFVLAFSCILLASCGESQIEHAERRLATIEKAGGSKAEICSAKRDVAEAYLEGGDAKEYEREKLYADIACTGAHLDRMDGR